MTALLLIFGIIFGIIVAFVVITLLGCYIVNCIFNALERKDAKEAIEKFDQICEEYERRAEERMEQLRKQYEIK